MNPSLKLKMKGYLRIAFLCSIIIFFWAAYKEAPRTSSIILFFDKEEIQDIEKIYGWSGYIDETLGKELKGDRKGMGCGCTKSSMVNKKINQAIDNRREFFNIDYSYGELRKIRNGYGCYYEIIPSATEMIFYSIKIGALWALLPFGIICVILPIFFAIIGCFFTNLFKGIEEIFS